MKVEVLVYYGQLCILLLMGAVALWCSCTRTTHEVTIIPPPTYPLSRSVIGYGVVNVSYTHVVHEPGQEGVSLGYLRRGSVVRILERRLAAKTSESWVLIDGNYRGWLRETVVDIYGLEAQAKTAAEMMTP
ncbi:MAG: hypothetical protein LBB80_05825 [Treponema sp.]|jgi:hypothetical protein|nr:hypothetical protein [Treponema sp.]